MNNSQISVEPIVNLLTDSEGRPRKFLVPSYQRGYRWKQLQVRQLLDDIWDFALNSDHSPIKENFYCLQPIVLRNREDGQLEIVDGQQRLTTIFLILTFLQKQKIGFNEPIFEIHYATRGEVNEPFLNEIDFDRCDENIDFFHMCEAYRTIEDWFENLLWIHRTKFLQHLINDNTIGRNVKVIWYQLPEQDSPIEAFTRLNVGKIQLTNDELIRGLFLRKDKNKSGVNNFQLRVPSPRQVPAAACTQGTH